MRLLLSILFLLLHGAVTKAQIVDVHSLSHDSLALYRFEMRDGSVFFGRVVAEEFNSLTVQTLQIGSVTVQKASVLEVRQLDIDHFQYYRRWMRHPSPNQYMLSPSAFMLPKGRAQYRNQLLLAHAADVAVTDHVSIAGGFEFIQAVLDDEDGPGFFVQPKAGVRLWKDLHAAASVLFINGASHAWYDRNRRTRITEVIPHIVLTYGNADNHLSVGGGRFSTHDRAPENFITCAGSVRMTKAFSLMTENFWFPLHEHMVHGFSARLNSHVFVMDIGLTLDRSLGRRDGITQRPLPFLGMAVLFGSN